MTLDVTNQIPPSDLTREVRALVLGEDNGTMDAEDPGPIYDGVVRSHRFVRTGDSVMFFRFADVLEARRHPSISRQYNPELNPSMGTREPLIPLYLHGAEHKKFRRLLDPLLAPRAIDYIEPKVRTLTNELIDGFADRGQVEFHGEFAVPLPCLTFLGVMGLPLGDLAKLREIEMGILHNEGRDRVERGMIGLAAGDRLREYLAAELDRRDSESLVDDGLISKFMTFDVDGDRLSRDEIINICHLFVVAGLDTVTASLTCMIGWLARHPEEQQLLRDDPALVPNAIEELMRYHSPVLGGGGSDRATEDLDIGGVRVNAGERVAVCWATANHDPEQFSDPHDVRFDRETNRHLAFASGSHRCIGSHLARIELRVAMTELHLRLPPYSIKPGDHPVYNTSGVREASYLPLVF